MVEFKKLDSDDLNKIERVLDFSDKDLNSLELELSIGKAKVVYNGGVKTSSFHISNSRSIYFKVNKSIIRVSDHWSQNTKKPRSRKQNCGLIDIHRWVLNDDHELWSYKGYPKKYGPRKMTAGIASVLKLRKDGCTHF